MFTDFGRDIVSLPILWYNGVGDEYGKRIAEKKTYQIKEF